jgi:hypothetical protein
VRVGGFCLDYFAAVVCQLWERQTLSFRIIVG